jgi:chromosome segregation ATPase
MNAFWDQFASKEAELIWNYVLKCAELDMDKHGEGCGLDEVNAHRFLEKFGETLTVMALREKLRSTGAISQSDRPKLVPLTHYLLFKYNVDWHVLVNTKGDNTGEIAEAQKLLDSVTSAFLESDKQLKIARDAEAAARIQEAPFKAAQEELEAAVADVQKQEDERNAKTTLLQKKSEEGSTVQQSKAKAELAQHLAEDPLPLRKSKITLEAARKKAEKARAPFEAATKVAEAARAVAEDALEQTRKRVAEAEAYLDEVKKKPGTPHGAIWWMERELEEKKKFLPERKGGVKKN